MMSGSQFVSTTATTGMPSRFASVTAMCSFFVSMTNTMLGSFSRFRIPPRLRLSLTRSRLTLSPSFLIIWSTSPVVTRRSSSRIFATRACTVWKFVSMPPSQRKFTYGMPLRRAWLSTGSWACFFVPTNITVPPSATVLRTNRYAVSIRSSVCCRSMM